MVGLVLLYQNATDHWESWAYAWALVGPGGSGIGMLLYGTRSGDRKMARDGFWTLLTALGIFGVGLLFFEGILGISGDRLPLPTWVMPVAVIGIGVLVLVRGLTFREQRGPAWGTEEGGSETPAPTTPDDAGKAAEAADATPAEEPRADA
jgi:drug/metabolite transporter (DMT)-like permease